LKKIKWSMDPEEYFRVLETKATDIEGHMRVGAIFAGGTNQEIKAIARYGKYLGTLLLIREDFVDVYEPDELMNRIKYECLPLPVVYALQNSTYKREALKILSKESIDEEDTSNLVEIIYKIPETSQLKRRLKALKRKALTEITCISQKKAIDKFKLIISSTLEDL